MKAKKSLGQNFLINTGIIEKIITLASVRGENIIEVGPGRGALTEILAKDAKRLTCIEKDSEIAQELRDKYSGFKNVEIIEGDALSIDLNLLGIKEGEYKIVANIPYYITSHLIRDILYKWPAPKEAILMVQKEVAQRIVAVPPDMNLLAVFSQLRADIKNEFKVSAGSFRPTPKVDSAVISIKPKREIDNIEAVEKVIKAGFSQKRKQLASNLSNELGIGKDIISSKLTDLGISPDIRAESLTIEEWIRLSQNILQ